MTATNADVFSQLSKALANNAKLTNQLTNALMTQDTNQQSGLNNKINKNKKHNNEVWLAWVDPDAYSWTCGYKLNKGHSILF